MPSVLAALGRIRLVAVLVFVLALLASVPHVAAQAPPAPPHQFFGNPQNGSSATLNGETAPDGTAVVARNESGEIVGTTVIQDGLWLLAIHAEQAASVSFTLGESDSSPSFAVESGALTSVTLNLNASQAEDPPAGEEDDGPTESILGGLDLVSGWNEVLWVEPVQPIAEALRALSSQLGPVFHWESRVQRWTLWAVNLPDTLNTLTHLETGRIYWIWQEEEPSSPSPSSTPVVLLWTELRQDVIGTPVAVTRIRNTSSSDVDAVDIRYCMKTRFGEPVFRYDFGSDCVRGLYQPVIPLAPGEEVSLSLTLFGYDTAGELEASLVRVRWVSGSIWP